jgi:hypothetical protein
VGGDLSDMDEESDGGSMGGGSMGGEDEDDEAGLRKVRFIFSWYRMTEYLTNLILLLNEYYFHKGSRRL